MFYRVATCLILLCGAAHASPLYIITALEKLPAAIESRAFGLNDVGQAVGDSRFDRSGNIGQARPVLWDSSGTPTELWDDPFIGGSGADINNHGTVVGRFGSGSGIPLPTPGVLPGRAFVWDADTGRRDLGIQPFGNSMAVAINDAGQVAGTSEIFEIETVDGTPTATLMASHPFIYDEATGIRELETLGRSSQAVAINDLGQVLGIDFGIGAVIWDLNTGSRFEVPGGRDLNNLGQTVGGMSIWDQSQGLQSLQDLIPLNSGWEIEFATAINEGGNIVGFGTLDQERLGFLLTPVPEPNTMLLITMSVAALVAYHCARSAQVAR